MENIFSTIGVIIFIMISITLIISRLSPNQDDKSSWKPRISDWICNNRATVTSAFILITINIFSVYSRYSNYMYWSNQQEVKAGSPPAGTIIVADNQELNIAWHKSYSGEVQDVINLGGLIIEQSYAGNTSDDFIFCTIAYIAQANQCLQKHGYNPEIIDSFSWLSEIDNPSVQLQLARAHADEDKWEK